MKNIILLFTAITVVGVSLYADLQGNMTELENSTLWFQRSGAALVVIGALMEAKYVLRYPLKSLSVGDQEPSWFEKLKNHLGFVVILVGTLIWGYGDLIV